VFDHAEAVDQRVAASDGQVERFDLCLLGMPVRVFSHYRTWYDELRRELRLLALNYGEEYPVARELSDLTLQVEQERRQATGVHLLDGAIAAGADRVDLVYQVPRNAADTMTRLREVLEEVDRFCREHRLLTPAPSPQQLALRSWYLGEFGRQAAGEDPVPWSGGYTVEDTPG
jgi:hypothetical protein